MILFLPFQKKHICEVFKSPTNVGNPIINLPTYRLGTLLRIYGDIMAYSWVYHITANDFRYSWGFKPPQKPEMLPPWALHPHPGMPSWVGGSLAEVISDDLYSTYTFVLVYDICIYLNLYHIYIYVQYYKCLHPFWEYMCTYDMIWYMIYDMIWYGMIWYDMIWYVCVYI